MTTPARGRVPLDPKGKFTEQIASHIQKRLLALERALAGGNVSFLAPTTPTFGGGPLPSGGSGGSGGGVGGSGVTDHGALTGLADDDHPQYLLRTEQTSLQPHVHGEWDVAGLENRLVVRGESVRAAAHVHGAQDVVGIDGEFVRRGEGVRGIAHQHILGDVADFNLWEQMLWRRVFGG